MERCSKVFRLLLLSFLLSPIILHASSPLVEEGILDLRQQSGELYNISLSGDWQFFWHELLDPENPDAQAGESIIAEVPAYWTSYEDQIPDISGTGYGTYRLKVLLPQGFRDSLALNIPVIDCSYEMFLNGARIAGSGKVGRSKESSLPGYLPEIFSFMNKTDTLDIMVHVSNFHHRRGGIWLDLKLGEKKLMVRQNEKWKVITYGLIGILFISILLFAFLYAYFKDHKIYLYFALATTGILLRLANTGFYPGLFFFDQEWTFTIRVEYLGTMVAIVFGAYYFNVLFPSKFIKKVTNYNAILFAILAIPVLFLKPLLFSYVVFPIQLVALLLLLYYLIRSIPGFKKGKIMETTFFISATIFLLAALNDSLVSHSTSPLKLDYLLHIAFLVFVELQIFMALREWITTYKEKLAMHNELEHINMNLERLVDTRTQDLEKSNEELRQTLEFRNRMFSIIAHDLKSPVAMLAQQTDLLKKRFKGEKDEESIKEMNRLSHASVYLIDNLLIWGRKQENKIQYNPTILAPSELMDEVILLLQVSIDKKQITITRQMDPQLAVYCDPTLLRLILQNLLTNAVKFTRENGEILLVSENYEGMVRISINDNGVGMDEEKIQQIEDNNVTSTIGTSGEKGTGLGLILVKELVEINKGSLQIESKPGKGTRVMFTLPGKP